MVEDDPRSGGSSTSTDLTMAAIIDKDGRLTLEEIAQEVELSFFFSRKKSRPQIRKLQTLLEVGIMIFNDDTRQYLYASVASAANIVGKLCHMLLTLPMRPLQNTTSSRRSRNRCGSPFHRSESSKLKRYSADSRTLTPCNRQPERLYRTVLVFM